MNTKIVLVDGLQVETTDQGAAAITKLIADIAARDASVAARAVVLDHARKVLGKDFTGAGLTDAAIRKAAVAKQLGDAVVADMDDAAIGGAFKVIEGAKVAARDAIAAVVLEGVETSVADSAQRALSARDEMIKGLNSQPAAGEA